MLRTLTQPPGPSGAPPSGLLAGHLLLRLLGEGGLARVYEAVHLESGAMVALKVLRGGPEAPREQVLQLFEEARVMRRFRHPGVLGVLGRGIAEDGSAWLAMPVVKGSTLRELLRLAAGLRPDERRRWTVRRGLPTLLAAAEVLAYAHRRGVIHRDFKPANVLVGSGDVFVLDWGLAVRSDGRRVEPEAPAPFALGDGSGSFTGTPGYMSPEQLVGPPEALDERADVFAFGVVLYEVLCGERAFPADRCERPSAAVDGPALAPRARSPELDVPAELSEIAMRALAPERSRRHRTMDELIEALRAALRLELAREGAPRRAA